MKNKAMIKIATQFDFNVTVCYEDSAVIIVLNLQNQFM